MLQFTDSGADVPSSSAPLNADGGQPPQANGGQPPQANGGQTPQREPMRHLLFGSLAAVQLTVKTLHKMGYAEPNDWSKPIPTGRPGEVMAILVKHLWVD